MYVKSKSSFSSLHFRKETQLISVFSQSIVQLKFTQILKHYLLYLSRFHNFSCHDNITYTLYYQRSLLIFFSFLRYENLDGETREYHNGSVQSDDKDSVLAGRHFCARIFLLSGCVNFVVVPYVRHCVYKRNSKSNLNDPDDEILMPNRLTFNRN